MNHVNEKDYQSDYVYLVKLPNSPGYEFCTIKAINEADANYKISREGSPGTILSSAISLYSFKILLHDQFNFSNILEYKFPIWFNILNIDTNLGMNIQVAEYLINRESITCPSSTSSSYEKQDNTKHWDMDKPKYNGDSLEDALFQAVEALKKYNKDLHAAGHGPVLQVNIDTKTPGDYSIELKLKIEED